MEYVYSNKSNTIIGSKRGRNYRKRKATKMFQNILLLVMIFITISIFFNVNLGKDQLTTKTMMVSSGTTLWNIANNVCDKNEDLNIQNVILHIKKLNNLQDSMIYEGQELLVYNY
ncbi:MAG: LysM peptidoglycan-binding domain-containing protein [Clostridia bacterium]|nr:LysM peptidoglycan-binding domain-containing protein [Clostridia bacterium]MDD4376331.1 LysM peptidoglycan-binding domain-containing protein [Clostridia bacterium]